VPRVYIHELVDVIGTERARYQHHMTANWCPEAGPLRRQRCFGVFSTVGSTGRWPQVVNLWEYDSWDDLAHNFSFELVGAGHRDPMLEQWWREAASFRTGGFDRILVAHEASPGVEDWCARGGPGAVAYVHEIIRTEVDGAARLADVVAEDREGVTGRFGLELVGLWRTAMRAHDEVIVLRCVPDWESWAAFESWSAAAGPSGPSGPPGTVELQRTLLVDAELSPLRIGRQPSVDDRRPLDQI
jgi:hypothetical protein